MSVITATGVGVESPISSYSAAISEMFPRPNRNRMIETAIASKQDVDILPINAGFDNKITDKYVEFNIPKAHGSFIDMSSLALELKIKVTKNDGTNLGDDDKLVFVNGLVHTMFKSASVFLGGVQVENNYLYNYSAFLKMLTTLNHHQVKKLGRNAFFFLDEKGSGIVDKYDDTYFTNLTNSEKLTMTSIKKDGVHLCSPLLLNLSGIDSYLLDGIDVNIRLEFASPSFIINTSQSGNEIKLHVELCKLWATRVFPQPEAMAALNASLNEPGNYIDYIYNKTITKSYVIAMNQSTIAVDLPWNNCIPSKIYLMIVDMKSFSGAYDKNPLYLTHGNLNGLSISVNGRSLYQFKDSFPKEFASIYYYTLKSIGIAQDNLLYYDAFTKGRMIIVLDLKSEDIKEAIDPEFTGNLRINMTFSQTSNSNRMLLLFGDTQGILRVNHDRQIYSDVRA